MKIYNTITRKEVDEMIFKWSKNNPYPYSKERLLSPSLDIFVRKFERKEFSKATLNNKNLFFHESPHGTILIYPLTEIK